MKILKVFCILLQVFGYSNIWKLQMDQIRIVLFSLNPNGKGRPQNKKVSFWLTFSRPPPSPPLSQPLRSTKKGVKPMLET